MGSQTRVCTTPSDSKASVLLALLRSLIRSKLWLPPLEFPSPINVCSALLISTCVCHPLPSSASLEMAWAAWLSGHAQKHSLVTPNVCSPQYLLSTAKWWSYQNEQDTVLPCRILECGGSDIWNNTICCRYRGRPQGGNNPILWEWVWGCHGPYTTTTNHYSQPSDVFFKLFIDT